MKLDILAIGAHPDDIELSCGGTILKEVAAGKKVGVLDLTRGELGTRGSAEDRDQEAAASAKILKLSVRENLGFRDGFFTNDETHQLSLIEVIRKYQPDIVLANANHDRHPDHGRAAKLIYDAVFLGGLSKIKTESNGKTQESWCPKALYNYIQAMHIKPDFVVDVSSFVDRKMQAIFAYKSQFYNPESKEKDTFISSPEFIAFLKARMAEFGTIAGCKYAEGFVVNRLPVVNLISDLG